MLGSVQIIFYCVHWVGKSACVCNIEEGKKLNFDIVHIAFDHHLYSTATQILMIHKYLTIHFMHTHNRLSQAIHNFTLVEMTQHKLFDEQFRFYILILI